MFRGNFGISGTNAGHLPVVFGHPAIRIHGQLARVSLFRFCV